METKEIKLTDVCDFQGGTQPPKEEWIDEQREGYVRMLQIRDFTQGKAEHVEFVKDTKKLNKCKPDDILIGRYGASVGKILTGLEGAYNVAIIKTIPDETKLLKKYLYYVLTGIAFQNFISRIGARAAQAGFNKDDLTYFKLHLPSLENQERIANILSKAEGLIKDRKQSILLLDDLIKFSFKKVFGNPILNEKKWELKTLQAITTKITDGKHGDCVNEENSGYYFISAKDLVNGKIEYNGVREITKKDFEETHKRTRLELNDILIGNTGASIGKIAFVVDSDKASRTTFQKSIAIVTTNNAFVTAKFLRAYLEANREHLDRISSGSGQKNLLLSQLRSLKIIIPPLELQNQFVRIVEQIESMKVDYEKSNGELEKLFASLGQKAFRGELNIIDKIEIKGTIKIQPKISAEVIAVEKTDSGQTKIPTELSDFISKYESKLVTRHGDQGWFWFFKLFWQYLPNELYKPNKHKWLIKIDTELYSGEAQFGPYMDENSECFLDIVKVKEKIETLEKEKKEFQIEILPKQESETVDENFANFFQWATAYRQSLEADESNLKTLGRDIVGHPVGSDSQYPVVRYWNKYIKDVFIPKNFKTPFSFSVLWKEITSNKFHPTPDYDEFTETLFEWLAEENSFIKQQYNETAKQIELVLNETATA